MVVEAADSVALAPVADAPVAYEVVLNAVVDACSVVVAGRVAFDAATVVVPYSAVASRAVGILVVAAYSAVVVAQMMGL